MADAAGRPIPAPDDRVVVEMPSPRVTERAAPALPGIPMLGLCLLMLVAGVCLVVGAGLHGAGPRGGGVARAAGVALVLLGGAAAWGLTPVAPGEARVVQLFGRYVGTVRGTGLWWLNPLARRHRVSTKIRNHETAVAKVNDADGSPIEIAAVVVWQVDDPARALFEVEDVARFVNIQSETAVRHVATSYPYDARQRGQLSLRENAREVTSRLSAEIAARAAAAGVRIIESRLTRLAYAPEVAQAMLRRQQAEAVVAARQRIVEGAVGMVELALARLEEEGLVNLDDERRAAMVSNLLVVLCSDQASQPVINAGSLYH